ncbi:hypothetical protein J437_LFUL006611 [Ladona fulva]|uniref:PiggyBac transposable element-derived protein domain-containing protein n=1 Tax=Ladona fulva TaxID=123851 RepID=A0A8K0KIC2_LADFU|nr:hypothetical protein J437_LFUL006611 [Ladona fulva]
MNTVDRQDQQLVSFPITRRYAKGYHKVFFYMMDMVVYNMCVLYKKISGKRIQFDDFREDLAEKILEGVKLPKYKRCGRPPSGPSPMCFQVVNWGHFPNRIPPKHQPCACLCRHRDMTEINKKGYSNQEVELGKAKRNGKGGNWTEEYEEDDSND